jgi:hypothetical protein
MEREPIDQDLGDDTDDREDFEEDSFQADDEEIIEDEAAQAQAAKNHASEVEDEPEVEGEV